MIEDKNKFYNATIGALYIQNRLMRIRKSEKES